MSTRVAVIGASGRTGALILSVLPEFPSLALSAAIVSSESKKVGSPTSYSGISYSSDLEDGVAASDLVIDFSTPASAARAVSAAAKHRKPLLVATTGLSPQQLQGIEGAAQEIPILVASNTSVGIFAMGEISALAQKLLGPSYDIEMMEIHHRFKKDAPSGTALTLARGLKEQTGFDLALGRSADPRPRRDAEIGVESLRGGDVPGEHTIYFFGKGERIELTHRVTDRAVFARGALRLGEALLKRKPGLYKVADLLRA